jgi:hypothetical protein
MREHASKLILFFSNTDNDHCPSLNARPCATLLHLLHFRTNLWRFDTIWKSLEETAKIWQSLFPDMNGSIAIAVSVKSNPLVFLPGQSRPLTPTSLGEDGKLLNGLFSLRASLGDPHRAVFLSNANHLAVAVPIGTRLDPALVVSIVERSSNGIPWSEQYLAAWIHYLQTNIGHFLAAMAVHASCHM